MSVSLTGNETLWPEKVDLGQAQWQIIGDDGFQDFEIVCT